MKRGGQIGTPAWTNCRIHGALRISSVRFYLTLLWGYNYTQNSFVAFSIVIENYFVHLMLSINPERKKDETIEKKISVHLFRVNYPLTYSNTIILCQQSKDCKQNWFTKNNILRHFVLKSPQFTQSKYEYISQNEIKFQIIVECAC